MAMALRVHLVALLIVTLMFSAGQCVVTCAADGPHPVVPPCHQHKTPVHETSADCGHDFLLPDAHHHMASSGLAQPIVENTLSFVVIVTSAALVFSPPNPSLTSSSILRI